MNDLLSSRQEMERAWQSEAARTYAAQTARAQARLRERQQVSLDHQYAHKPDQRPQLREQRMHSSCLAHSAEEPCPHDDKRVDTTTTTSSSSSASHHSDHGRDQAEH